MRSRSPPRFSLRPQRLDTATLIECARTKNQEHLLAISRRKTLPEELTDVLVERGDQQVVLSTAKNAGARFSGKGFEILVYRSQGDDALTSCVGLRSDLPPQLLEQLLAAASEKVRTALVAEREYAKAEIERVVGEVADRIQTEVLNQPLSYATAQILVESMHQAGLLTAGKLQEFASTGRFEEMVAALSLMSNVPTAVIEQHMRDTRARIVAGPGQGDRAFVGNHPQHHDACCEAIPSFGKRGRPGHGCIPSPAPNDGPTDPRFPSHADGTRRAQALGTPQSLQDRMLRSDALICASARITCALAAYEMRAIMSCTNSLARSTFGLATMPLLLAKGAVGSNEEMVAGETAVTVALVPPPTRSV